MVAVFGESGAHVHYRAKGDKKDDQDNGELSRRQPTREKRVKVIYRWNHTGGGTGL